MKITLPRLLVLTSIMLLTACATAPQMQIAPSVSPLPPHSIGLAPGVEKGLNNNTHYLDDKNSITYVQNFGGGGLALGLLGPFGVAANVAMIAKNTENDVELLKGKILLDPRVIFSEVLSEHPTLGTKTTTDKSVRLSGFLNVVKQEGEKLFFGCTVLVDYRPLGTNWVGRYVYQLPLEYTKAEVAEGLSTDRLNTLTAQVREGFRTLAKLYLDDASGNLVSKRDIKFKSTFVLPRFDFELIGQELPSEDQKVNIRSVGAVYSLPKNYIQIVN